MGISIMVERKRLRDFLKAISMDNYSPKVLVEFGENGVDVLNPGIGKQIMVKTWFDTSFFIEYASDGVKVGMPCDQLDSILRSFQSPKVRVTLEKEKIVLIGLTESGKEKEIAKVPSIVVDETEIEQIKDRLKIVETAFGEIIVPSTMVDRVEDVKKSYGYAELQALKGTSLDPLKVTKVTFKVGDDGRLYLTQINDVGVEMTRNIAEEVINGKPGVSVSVSIEYIKSAMNTSISGLVYLGLGVYQDGDRSVVLPLIVSDKSKDYRISVPIAPIVSQ